VSQKARRIGKLILVPTVITLAVTSLRLVGELQGWLVRVCGASQGGRP
jgi:hypothetical protein